MTKVSSFRLAAAVLSAATVITPVPGIAMALAPGQIDETSALTEVETRIIGGETSKGTWPWIARFEGCGGALVAPQWVVTAAHCMDVENNHPNQVRIGSNDEQAGGVVVGIVKQIPHPEFVASGLKRNRSDYGLLKLAQPVNAPVIAPLDASPQVGLPVLLLGWGSESTDASLNQFPRYLKQLESSIHADRGCKDLPGGFSGDNELCINNPKGVNGACYGDSGSPLVTKVGQEWKLAGVTNRGGFECGKTPSIYADAAAHSEWTRKTIAADS